VKGFVGKSPRVSLGGYILITTTIPYFSVNASRLSCRHENRDGAWRRNWRGRCDGTKSVWDKRDPPDALQRTRRPSVYRVDGGPGGAK